MSAVLGAVLMVVGSLALGESYPFTMVPMFSSLGHQTETAVIVFLVDGQSADIRGYQGFQGLDLNALRTDAPLGLAYQRDDLQTWLEAHSAPAGDEAGPHHVAVGFDTYTLRGGEVQRTRSISVEGTAWSR